MPNKKQTRDLVETYMNNEGKVMSTQQILDSGAVPRLKGYVVRPGKVSDSIFGGEGSYFDKKAGKEIEFDNPMLETKDGVPLRIMVRTQRISTHDINRGEIPFKDQILAVNHNYMRDMLKDIIGTSQYDVEGLPDNAVVIASEDLKQIGFENVLRAYMAKSSTSTSLYQHYIKGGREFCGYKLDDDLIPNGPLTFIMDTPSTKSDDHDESLSPSELIERGICTLQEYEQIRITSSEAFKKVSDFLRKKGLIMADTKTEHGINKKGEIVSQDELMTLDSSRFWLLDDYNNQMTKFKQGRINEINPKSYSKEFARGFSEGDKGYTDEQRVEIALRYLDGIHHLIGKKFEPDMRPREERVITGLQTIVEKLVAK